MLTSHLLSGSYTMFYVSGNGDNSQSMDLLQAAVNSDPNYSKGGGGITVVDGVALISDHGPAAASGSYGDDTYTQSGEISVYVVRKGDSLSQIAEMFNVTSDTIRWTNDINGGGDIQIGQVLVILPVTGITYTILDGDTISSIAKEFKGDKDEILEFNGLEASSLSVGDEIIIPHGVLIETQTNSATKYAAPLKGSGGPAYAGYYLRPVNGGVKTQGLHGYNAVDIGAPYGTPILASASGEVIFSKYAEGNPWFGGYGNYIVLKHNNGTQTVYAHLSSNLVKRGWNVVQGQVIGYMGSTGRSTGNHIHFEIRGAQNPF